MTHMKKVMLALLVATVPMIMQAQSTGLFGRKGIKAQKADISAYSAKGAIPEVNGKVVFSDIITAPGKSKDEIFSRLAQWVSLRYEPNSTMSDWREPEFFANIEYAKVKTADKQSGKIECQGAEELIFSIKPLAKNYTQAFYLLDLQVSDGKVEFNLNTLSFNVDQGEGQFVRMTAEEWITDKECLNKKGELRRIPGKFRIKTIDLVTELKKEIAAAIN